jgi:hypothetical protein
MYGYTSPEAKREQSLYINLFCDLGRAKFTDEQGKRLISAPEEELLRYIAMIKDNPCYRIKIYEDSSVETTCYDLLDNFKPELDNHYEHLDDLPEWAQNKLAVLMLLDHTKHNEEVKDVGRRISEDIYWVFKRENDGGDPRIES